MLFKGLTRLFNKTPPHPTFENVDPDGAGYYRYVWQKKKWQRVSVQGFDARARWLSNGKLLELKLDAVIAARVKRGKRR